MRPTGPISAPQLWEEGMWFASGHALALTHDQGESGGLLPCEGSQVEPQARSCSSMAGPRDASRLLTQCPESSVCSG